MTLLADLTASLPPWFPRSVFGLVIAILYTLIAIVVVKLDRKESGGGWITLHGMGAFLVTFPASMLGEAMGMKPDYRSNIGMGIAILFCALLVYLVGAGLGWAASFVASGGGTP